MLQRSQEARLQRGRVAGFAYSLGWGGREEEGRGGRRWGGVAEGAEVGGGGGVGLVGHGLFVLLFGGGLEGEKGFATRAGRRGGDGGEAAHEASGEEWAFGMVCVRMWWGRWVWGF